MASAQTWLELLAWTKALFDAIVSSADVYEAYKKHKAEKDTRQEASRVSGAYSTYSEEEVFSMLDRLKGCRDRFIEQGSGEERAKCICSVLREAMKGNGGKIPEIDDWKRIYSTLKCRSD